MKNLKKVLALVVALTMVLGTVSFAFTDVAEDSDVYTAVQTLSSLSILNGYEDGTFGPEKDITRAEFATVVCRALGLGNPAKGATQFADVPADHWAAGYINLVAGQGIVNGYGDGNFGPEDNVTYEQAVKMLVVALGYEPMAAQKGGYPTGYLVVANTYGLTDGVNAPADAAAANRGVVAHLTYNALDIPMMAQTGFGTNVEYKIQDGNNDTTWTTLLTGLDVAKLDGVVKATYIVGGTSATDEIYYEIDNANDDAYWTQFESATRPLVLGEGVNADAYFGMASSVYVKEIKSGKWEVIAIMPGEDSAVVELDKGDIDTIDASVIKYFETATATRATTLNLDIAAASDGATSEDIIINNAMASINDVKALGADAEIKVIENNGDSKYDMIIVKDYAYGVIDTVEADRDRYTLKNVTGRFVFDFEDETVANSIVNKDGEAITLADFAEGDVVAYITEADAKSNFKWCEIINLGQNAVAGTITEIGTDNIIYIDGVEYEKTANYVGTTNVSDEGIYFLTNTGKVFAGEIDSSVSSNYAYILEMGMQSGGFSNGMQYKLLTKEGEIKIFDVKDTYKINGSDVAKDAETTSAGLPANFVNIKANTTTSNFNSYLVKERFVTYKLDGNGKIREINTIAGGNFTAVGTVGSDATAVEYKGAAMAIGGKVLAEDAVIFNLVGSDMDDAFVTTVNSLVDESKYIGFVVKNADNENDAFIITDGQGAIDLTQDFAVVDSINTITVNDDDAWKVRYYTAGDDTLKELTITADADVEWGSDASVMDKGSIFMFADDGNGVATSYGVIAVAEESKVASDAAYWVNPAAASAINAEQDLEFVAGFIASDGLTQTKNGTNLEWALGMNSGMFTIKSDVNGYTYNNNVNKPVIVAGDWMAVNSVDVRDGAVASYFIAVVENGVATDIITFSTARNIGA